jgi:hypothetical protein
VVNTFPLRITSSSQLGVRGVPLSLSIYSRLPTRLKLLAFGSSSRLSSSLGRRCCNPQLQQNSSGQPAHCSRCQFPALPPCWPSHALAMDQSACSKQYPQHRCPHLHPQLSPLGSLRFVKLPSHQADLSLLEPEAVLNAKSFSIQPVHSRYVRGRIAANIESPQRTLIAPGPIDPICDHAL